MTSPDRKRGADGKIHSLPVLGYTLEKGKRGYKVKTLLVADCGLEQVDDVTLSTKIHKLCLFHEKLG